MSLASDKPQAFPITEDVNDQTGKPLSHAQEGAVAAGKNAAPILVGKDPSGNLQYIALNSSNEVRVDSESAEVACLSGSAKVTGNNSVEQTVLTITLAASREYRDIGWSVSNFRQTEYRVIWVDDVGGADTETELTTVLVGPGQYNSVGELECLSFTSGATGVQELRLVGLNKDAASDLRGTLSVKEVQ